MMTVETSQDLQHYILLGVNAVVTDVNISDSDSGIGNVDLPYRSRLADMSGTSQRYHTKREFVTN